MLASDFIKMSASGILGLYTWKAMMSTRDKLRTTLNEQEGLAVFVVVAFLCLLRPQSQRLEASYGFTPGIGISCLALLQ